MLRLSFFCPIALATVFSWHAGQQSFSFEAPTITAALGWESPTITGLIWYPVSANLPLRQIRADRIPDETGDRGRLPTQCSSDRRRFKGERLLSGVPGKHGRQGNGAEKRETKHREAPASGKGFALARTNFALISRPH